MKNIRQFINSDTIAYYNELNNDRGKELMLTNPIEFIEEYLSRGDKIPDELRNTFRDENNNQKFYHTAAIYLLGIILYNNNSYIRESINKYLSLKKGDINQTIVEDFLYNWFLLCFFHDFGYSTVTQTNLKYSVFESRDKSYIREKIKSIINEITDKNRPVVPPILLQLYNQYDEYRLKYRQADEEFIDHGFFSGAYFLDDRRKMFRLKKRQYGLIGENDVIIHDKKTGLRWSKRIIEEIHTDVAAVIIGHNIFFKNSDDDSKKEYLEFGLNELIISAPAYRISDYPFYFLLTFVDTIDLFKAVGKYYKTLSYENIYNKVLDDISLSFKNDKIIIEFKDNDELQLSKSCKSRIKDQEYWLPIKSFRRKNRIYVHLK